MEKYKLHIDGVGYHNKPTQGQTGQVINRIKQGTPVEVSAQELADYVTRGHSWTPSVFRKGTKGINGFQQAQSFALDFDGGYSIEEALENHFIANNASFIYKSFNHTDEEPRFRVVFFFDKTMGRADTTELKDKMKNLFPNADQNCFDISRLYFGGKEQPIEVDYEAEIDVESFLGHEVEAVEGVVELGQLQLFESKEVKMSKKKEILYNIRWQKEEELKAHLVEVAESGWTVASRANAITKLKEIPLDKFLDVKVGESFHSLFRKDETPSVNVFQVSNGRSWLYKDFGTGEVLDIIQICQKLMQKGTYSLISRNYVIQFLMGCLDAKIEETEELKRMRDGIEEFGKFLLSDSLKEQYPSTARVFNAKTAKDVLAILNIFETHVYEDSGKEIRLSWLSADNIAKRIGTSPSRVKRLLKLMALTHVIEDLPDEEIPTAILEMIKQNQTHRKNSTTGQWEERKTARERRSSVKQITLLSDDFFQQFSERNDELIENNFSMKGLSYEWVYLTFGKEEAVRVYPQEEGRKISKKTDAFATMLAQTAMAHITEHGFVIVNELKEELKKKIGKSNFTEYKYKQCLNELLDGYGLDKKSLTNAMKEEFGITHLSSTARPAVLVKAGHFN